MIYAKKKAGRRKKERKKKKKEKRNLIEFEKKKKEWNGKKKPILWKSFKQNWVHDIFEHAIWKTTIIKQNFEIILRGGFQNCFFV